MKYMTVTKKFVSNYSSPSRLFSYNIRNKLKYNRDSEPFVKKSLHCYKTLFPWESSHEFSDYLISCIVYNQDGLLALNKPFGIKIHGHDKPGTRYAKNQRFVIPSIPDCDYTIEDSLPVLRKHFNLPNLTILKSAEKYTSGVVLLGSSDKLSTKLKRSFQLAKLQKKPHLVHWGITVGCSGMPYRQEKVGIKFLEANDGKERQPVIETDLSKRAIKQKKVYPVQVEYRTLSVNKALSTSLVEIASSSVRWHFVRVYACSRVAPLLGDIMYGSRMKTLLGVPVKVQLQNYFAYGVQPLPDQMYVVLNLPKGETGTKMIPSMLHLKSIILPDFKEKGQDLIISAEPPPYFKWTADKLGLFQSCEIKLF